MSNRNKIFIIVSLVAMVILAVSLFIIFAKKDQPKKSAAPTTTVVDKQNFKDTILPGVQPTVIPEGAKPKPLTEAQKQDSTIMQLAKIFVERYNTYSSDNSYQNIKDVKSMVTDDYWKKISAPLSNNTAASSFIGATTRFIGVGESNIKDRTATVQIKASKSLEKDGVVTSGFYDYTVSFEKVGSDWLVSNQVETKASPI